MTCQRYNTVRQEHTQTLHRCQCLEGAVKALTQKVNQLTTECQGLEANKVKQMGQTDLIQQTLSCGIRGSCDDGKQNP